MKFLSYSPLEGKKFQFMARVVGFSLCQTPTGIGDDSIYTIIMSLVEYSPKTRPTCIRSLIWPGEICIGKNR